MPHPLLAVLWITALIVVIAVLIWGAYTLTEIHKALERLRESKD